MKQKTKHLIKNRSIFPVNPILVIAFILLSVITINLETIFQKIKPVTNSLESDAYVKFIKSQTGRFDKNAKVALFLNKNVSLPVEAPVQQAMVLGDQAPDDNKWIEINLTNQTLYTHEGNSTTHAFLISSGLWGKTPTGTFRTYVKYRYTLMAGGSGADYYYLPNVPFTMYFYKGYGIHGTYWHNNFGHPMSHGCVNMRTSEAEIVYNWAPVGTKVVIHY